ncbi:MAG: T9SS type A sorting domain-containing protein [Bacteroidota bacterium]
MKKTLLLFAILLLYLSSYAQEPDPELFKTWYLTEMSVDQGISDYVVDVTPSITPTMTIEPSLEFYGDLACNGFGGVFTYNAAEDTFSLDEYNVTLVVCDYQEHITFESTHNGYFAESTEPVYYYVGPDYLELEFFPGFALIYQNEPLGVDEVVKLSIQIAPNPVSDILQVKSENHSVQSVNVYDIAGTRLIQQNEDLDQIEVNQLASGIYFLEVISERGKAIERFVKK